MLSIQFLHIGS